MLTSTLVTSTVRLCALGTAKEKLCFLKYAKDVKLYCANRRFTLAQSDFLFNDSVPEKVFRKTFHETAFTVWI